MLRTVKRLAAALLVSAAVATPVLVHTVPDPQVWGTRTTHVVQLADLAHQARLHAERGHRIEAAVLRNRITVLDDRGTHGVAGSLA